MKKLKKITALLLSGIMLFSINISVYAKESKTNNVILQSNAQNSEYNNDNNLEVESYENAQSDNAEDTDVQSLFNELKNIPEAITNDRLIEYPICEDGAFEYYNKRYGLRLKSILLEVKSELENQRIEAPADDENQSDKEFKSVGNLIKSSSTENIKWSVSGDTLTISGTGKMGVYNFYYPAPPWYEYRDSVTSIVISEGITDIGYGAFYQFKNVKSVFIPSSVKSIGHYAFSNCESLETMDIPSSVTSIGHGSFEICKSLKSLKLSENITEIRKGAFYYCKNLTSVVLPDSLKRLESNAFGSCDKLSSVYIGNELTVLGDNPFARCPSLKEFLSSEKSKLNVIDGVLFDEDKKTLICYPEGKKVDTYAIPESVVNVGNGAFSSFYSINDPIIKTLIIPDSVISIGDKAFYGTHINSVQMGNNVEEIGESAFLWCDFESINLPESLTRIGDEAFKYINKLSSITIPKSVRSIGAGAFNGNRKMTAITVNSSNKYFKAVDGVLYSKDGKTVYCYPDGKTNTTYKMPDTVEQIPLYAFGENKYLASITFSINLKSIDWFNFENYDALEEITLPDSLVEIKGGCFEELDNLKKVTLGANLAKIGHYTFYKCSNLSEIYFTGNLPADYEEMLKGCTTTVYYPQNDSTWKQGNLEVENKNLTFKPWDSSTHYRTNISESTVSLSTSSYTYDGTAKKPSVTVKHGSNTLTNGIDYELAYSNNTNAGTASIKIDGIGDYYGTVTKTFTISKASQILSASVSQSSILVNDTAIITVNGYGDITYSSDNTSVATVSSSGVITGKKEGTATITVNAAGNTNYNSASKTVSITVTAVQKIVTYDDLTYSFSNNKNSFGYPVNKKGECIYQIPYERYLMFFTPTQAKQKHEWDGYWAGSCAGFSGSTMLFNIDESSLSINGFNLSAKKVSDLKVGDKNNSMGINVQQLLESLQVAQNCKPVGSFKANHYGDYDGLVSEAKKCNEGGMPFYIAVRGTPGGHALVGYGYEYVNSSTDRVLAYDCNWPKESKYITLYKSNGEYTGFKYNDGHYYTFDREMSYVPGNVYLDLWEHRNTDSILNDTSLYINSDNFRIIGESGDTVATMKNGEFSSENNAIYEVLSDDTDIESYEIHLPTAEYKVESSDDAYEVPLELTVVNANQSASVKTQSNEVELFVDDSQNTNLVNVSGKSGEKYEIVFNSDTVYTTDNSEVVFSGKSKGKDVTVGMSYGEYINEGYTDSGIRVEDTAINLENFSAVNIADCNFKLEKSSYICTGAPVEADFTVTDSYGNDLTSGVDYTVVYNSNVKPGTATASIYGINNYNGSIDFEFQIEQASISSCQISLDSLNYVFTGEEIKPDVTVSLSGGELIENEDYTVEYSNNVNAGTAKATVSGKGGYTGSLTLEFYISPADVADCEISLDKTTYIYTGNEIKPTVNVKLNGVTLTLGKQYTVEYKNNVNIGRATVVVKGISDLSGEITKTFIISSGEYICGDVNSDGEVNAKDRMMLTRYLAKWSGYENIDMTAADVNNDGAVNAKDRMILTRHLAKWQGYESLPITF